MHFAPHEEGASIDSTKLTWAPPGKTGRGRPLGTRRLTKWGRDGGSKGRPGMNSGGLPKTDLGGGALLTPYAPLGGKRIQWVRQSDSSSWFLTILRFLLRRLCGILDQWEKDVNACSFDNKIYATNRASFLPAFQEESVINWDYSPAACCWSHLWIEYDQQNSNACALKVSGHVFISITFFSVMLHSDVAINIFFPISVGLYWICTVQNGLITFICSVPHPRLCHKTVCQRETHAN